MVWLHDHSYAEDCDLPCLESGIKTAARSHEEVDRAPASWSMQENCFAFYCTVRRSY